MKIEKFREEPLVGPTEPCCSDIWEIRKKINEAIDSINQVIDIIDRELGNRKKEAK